MILNSSSIELAILKRKNIMKNIDSSRIEAKLNSRGFYDYYIIDQHPSENKSQCKPWEKFNTAYKSEIIT